MTRNSDYLFFEKVFMATSKTPLKQYDAVAITTRNYVFVIPKRSTGIYLVATTITTHSFFINDTIENGCARLISAAKSVMDLEQTLISLLENDPKYVHNLHDGLTIKINKWFNTFNFRLLRSRLEWTAIVIKGKENGKFLRDFYGV